MAILHVVPCPVLGSNGQTVLQTDGLGKETAAPSRATRRAKACSLSQPKTLAMAQPPERPVPAWAFLLWSPGNLTRPAGGFAHFRPRTAAAATAGTQATQTSRMGAEYVLQDSRQPATLGALQKWPAVSGRSGEAPALLQQAQLFALAHREARQTGFF